MKSSREFTALFQQLGKNAQPLSINSLQQLEHFVCCMYGYPHFKETSRMRSIIFESRYALSHPRSASAACVSGIDLSLLPLCSSALKQHCLHTSYQACIWRHAHIAFPVLPSPDDCGWLKDDEGRLRIQ